MKQGSHQLVSLLARTLTSFDQLDSSCQLYMVDQVWVAPSKGIFLGKTFLDKLAFEFELPKLPLQIWKVISAPHACRAGFARPPYQGNMAKPWYHDLREETHQV